ncbi:hypothetical protein [Brevundimonas sp. NPDC058933]|uniref:hypothetical protein n=1 Tax=Brevundimonas sp. NPDC058933 TaxID=3346673 RepID=UPI003BEF4204
MSDHQFCERTGKIAYMSRAKANKAGAAMKNRNGYKRSASVTLEAFECRACGHWHLGNTLTTKPRPRTDWHPA